MAAVRRIARHVLNSLGPGAIILAYHRVTDIPSDPQLLAVKPSRFEEQMSRLKDEYEVIPLSNVLDRGHRSKKVRVAITFDDGYEDNLRFAEPILKKYDLPATIFVTAGVMGTNKEFWWDELESVLLNGDLPENLHLDTIPGGFVFELPDRGGAIHKEWNVLSIDPPGSRYALYRKLHPMIKSMNALKRRAVLDELWAWSGRDNGARSTHLPLTAQEVRKLSENKLVSIGSHGMTHSRLGTLSAAEVKIELNDSKDILESVTNRRVSTFSFPYGGKGDIDKTSLIQTSKIYDIACGNYPAWVDLLADPHFLPRFLVRDWNKDEFAGKMSEWSLALP